MKPPNGSQHKKTFALRRDAAAFVAELESSVNNGSYIDRSKQTLSQYLDDWYTTYTLQLRPNTRASHQLAIARICPYIGAVALQELTPTDIQKMVNDLSTVAKNWREKVLGAGSIRTYIKTLRKALEKAVDLKLIRDNPARKVDLPRYSMPEINPPSPEQEQQIFAQLTSGDAIGTAILLAAVGGYRCGEVAGLSWDAIDFDAGIIQIKQQLTYNKLTHALEIAPVKSDKSERATPITGDIVQALKDLRERQRFEQRRNADMYSNPNNLVFVDETGGAIPPIKILKHFQAAVQAAGITTRYRLHDLRHAYVTQLLDLGISVKSVQELVGHSSAAFTLKRYAHGVDDTKKEAVRLLAERLQK